MKYIMVKYWKTFYGPYTALAPAKLKINIYQVRMVLKSIWGSCKKFCHQVRITSVLRSIKHIFITNLQRIPNLLKHIFVTFLPSREKQINSLLLVFVGDTDE